jgi:SNF2 family DNA or RNA helicase
VGRKHIVIPGEGCVLVDGGPAKRHKLLREASLSHPEYVIMSYETVQSDTRMVKRLHPGLVVLDEASAIKNFGADRTLKIKTTLMSQYRIALTGTPVENKPEEAFSIMEWVDPDILGPADLFEKSYIDRNPNGTVKKYKNVALMNHKLSRAMVRRSRKDPEVMKYLPEVDHDQWYVDMDTRTSDVYHDMADDLLAALLACKGQGSFDMSAYYTGQGYNEMTGVGKVMARLTGIKLLLDHPELVWRSGLRYHESLEAQERGEEATIWPGSKYCYDFCQAHRLDPAIISTPKMDFLITKLDEMLLFPANKILVFSRYPEMLMKIQDRAGYPAVMYHGGMTSKQKAGAVATFTQDKDCRVFLSSHAGAYGTDMHMANYLINYDLPWSGGTWDQINGRHQRVSSEFGKVFIRDIIMKGTTEVRDLAMVRHKLKVAGAVVDGEVPHSGRIENDLISLTDFLQGG